MLRLLIVLILLCLSACGTTSRRGDSPASDLDALETSVARDLRQTTLPNGKTYCGEDAVRQRAQDECVGDLEDALYNSNADKSSALITLRKGIQRIKLSLNPCGFWAQLFKKERCTVK